MRTSTCSSLLALCMIPFAAHAADVIDANQTAAMTPATWTADNGNGTFTNPLFYDEFSDPDLIRVGDDYYLTGTTMHAMPGLPVLHSRDLVNWQLLSYAMAELNLGPEYRLERGEIYGQGIWAPCFRYHNGTFYIFANVNGQKTQLFTAKNPAGPWTHTQLGSSLHDLSVLFDDDGKIYAVWGYNEIHFAEMKPDLSDIKPETRKVVIPGGSAMGEGAHFYKLEGRYYIFSAQYDPICYHLVARADRPDGPYELVTTSVDEAFGLGTGWRLRGMGREPAITLIPPRPLESGNLPMHQGGIVQTQAGEWWGFSMMDHNSVGRLLCLSPVTWRDGWPYFGLPGNLTRTPKTWVKPNTGHTSPPRAPYQRSDDFSGPKLQPVWQWNHVPDGTKWSLTSRPGSLRLHSLPAKDFWTARNSLTQRAVGPESVASTELDLAGLEQGDVAGLAVLNLPYAWIAARRTSAGAEIVWHDQTRGESATEKIQGSRVWLRVHCNFDSEKAQFAYSTDGVSYRPLGSEVVLVFQLKTFQGVRYALFNYNDAGREGGYADFADFRLEEPRANGRGHGIPLGKVITLTSVQNDQPIAVWKGLLRAQPKPEPAVTRFRIVDRGRGRVALQAEQGGGFVTVTGTGVTGDVRVLAGDRGDASTFQWQRMENGDVMLLSLVTHRYLAVADQGNGLLTADIRGAAPDRRNGAHFLCVEAP